MKMHIFRTKDVTTPNIECDKSMTHERQHAMLSLSIVTNCAFKAMLEH